MVNRISTGHRATYADLTIKQTLKVLVARFVHHDTNATNRAFAKAEAKMAAKEAVRNAITELGNEGKFISPDLRSLNLIIAKARGGPATEKQPNDPEEKKLDTFEQRQNENFERRQKENFEWRQKHNLEQRQGAVPEQEQRNDPDFPVALFKAAWKESVGNGKLRILLKTKEGASRDGTRALKSDLRKLAKAGNWSVLEKATTLADVLDVLKKSQAGKGTEFEREDAISQAMAALEKLGIQVPKDIQTATMIKQIGKALTELLHPGLDSALEEVKSFPENSYTEDTLKMFKEHFGLFSSAEIWSNDTVKDSLYKYYGLALSITVLDNFGDKKNFTKQDIALLKGTLKDVSISEGGEETKEATGRRARFSDDLEKIDLKQNHEEILLRMSMACAWHYIAEDVIKLSDEAKSRAATAIGKATDADGVITALKMALEDVVLEMDIHRDVFFQPSRILRLQRADMTA